MTMATLPGIRSGYQVIHSYGASVSLYWPYKSCNLRRRESSTRRRHKKGTGIPYLLAVGRMIGEIVSVGDFSVLNVNFVLQYTMC